MGKRAQPARANRIPLGGGLAAALDHVMSDATGFEGEIVLDAPASPGAPAGAGELSARFVRYPGCQQLMLWLPADGPQNYTRLTITGPGGTLKTRPSEAG